MANDSDQITVKIHTFVIDYLSEMLEHFEKEGLNFTSELALHDVAVLHLHDTFLEAKKSKEGLYEKPSCFFLLLGITIRANP